MAANASVAYPHADGIARFDLAREMQQCEERKPWQAGHYSRTLLKERDIRLVLVMMETGARMNDHHADGSVSIHVLRGSIRLRAESVETDLGAGQILTLLPSIRHDVEALEASAFLLTLSWPESEKLRNMPHRGYGS